MIRRNGFGRCTSAIFMMMCLASPLVRAEMIEPKTEELRGGRWITVEAAPATQPAYDPTLLRIEDLINAGEFSDARNRCYVWLKTHPVSPQRDRALLLTAEALYRYGDRVKAFFYCDELMDEYPDSPLFYRALEKQYQIADEFLPSDKRPAYRSRFLGMHVLGREDEAVDMMYRIQQRSPGSPLAEKALLRTADFYYADRQYDLAGDAYAAYVRAYPRSPILARVKLREAYANLAQFRGPKFDATPAIDARAQLTELIQEYPELSREENLPALIGRIDRAFAQKLIYTGDFYTRTHEPVAAVYFYRFLINAYPDSPEAATAKLSLAKMPTAALQSPPPSGGPIGVPSTTQPSASAAE